MKWIKKTGISLLLALSICVYLAAPAFAASFSDVPDQHWSNSFVEKAYEKGLVAGIGDGKFGVDGTVSSAQWATMVIGLFISNEEMEFLREYISLFEEIGLYTHDYWWDLYVYLAVGSGLFENTDLEASLPAYIDFTGTFSKKAVSCAEAPISRYDMALVIYNIYQWYEMELDSPNTANIADYDIIPTKYRKAVKFCYENNFITGVDSNGTFAGDMSMTRGAAAVVLCRLSDVLIIEDYFDPDNPDFDDYFPSYPGDDAQDASEDPYVIDSSYIDTFNAEMLLLVNALRQQVGVAPLAYNPNIQPAADLRAKELDTFFSHERENGNYWYDTAKELGIKENLHGENIAMFGYDAPFYEDNKPCTYLSPEDAALYLYLLWEDSDGHYENMVHPSFTKFASSIYFSADEKVCAVQLFQS